MKNHKIDNIIFGGAVALSLFIALTLFYNDIMVRVTEASARLVAGEIDRTATQQTNEQVDLNRRTDIFEELIKFTVRPYSFEESNDQEEISVREEDSEDYLPEEEGSGKIIRKTYVYTESSSCSLLPFGGYIRNDTDVDIEYLLEQCTREPNVDIHIDDEPLVLIMHTHTTESYEDYAKEVYNASDAQRTTDMSQSVAAVGDVIAQKLIDAGIGVIHDTTVHDYPNYNGAYDRSSKTVEEILAQYPSIQIVIDVHRDAIEADGIRYAPVADINGKSSAQVMIICGNLNVPQYRYNLRFASRLQSKMEQMYPGLTRPLLFSERNYNQELTKNSFLIEMGSNSNSLDEAMYAGELVGVALAELIMEMDSEF